MDGFRSGLLGNGSNSNREPLSLKIYAESSENETQYYEIIKLKLIFSKFKLFATATFPSPLSLLPPCPSLHQIKQIHARITVTGLANKATVITHLLAKLSLSPSISSHYPLTIFKTLTHPNIFAYNNMIRCFAKSDTPRDSILLYTTIRRNKLVQVNNYTFPFVLQACCKSLAKWEGVQVHDHVVKFGFSEDVYVRNSLIHFYSGCKEVDNARKVFDESRECRDVVTWNAMITCYARNEQIDVAEKLFDEIPRRDVISWSTMIMGYVQGGYLEKALESFNEMRKKGLILNEAILVSVLSASAQLGLLERGEMVHSTMRLLNFPMSVSIGTALVDMYAKCGSIDKAREVFNEMLQRDVWSWNVMICGLATHGLAKEALELFEKLRSEGLCPGNVTFIGVLNACSRAGLVNEGRHYFKLMTETFKIEPEMEHFGCMVDLLGRAGFVAEALELVEKLEVRADPVLWATLLGACKIHGLVELGESLGKKLIELDPSHDGNYVLLANIYAKSRKWEDVVKVRRLMVDRCANKVAGWSLIEAQGKVHRFIAGDSEHHDYPEIYKMLKVIERRLTEAGYTPDISPVFHDIGEEEKEIAIRVHSERLAIAFGLLVTEAGACIRIVKNLRFCGDCHKVFKMISDVFDREIIVRDGSRFHHFKEGRCSCVDYW